MCQTFLSNKILVSLKQTLLMQKHKTNRYCRLIHVSTLVKIYSDKKATLIHIEKTY